MISLFLCSQFLSPASAEIERTNLMIGTDLPYQFHIGAEIEQERFKYSIRSGLLVEPYSTVTLSLIEAFGVGESYVRLLESSYQMGSMNSIGVHYFLDEKKRWYLGPELRIDYLMAAETTTEIIQVVTGRTVNAAPIFGFDEPNVRLGIWLHAIGFRGGTSFALDQHERKRVLVEFSLYKHYLSSASLSINGERSDTFSETLDTLLWEDVFLPYGFLGGLGLAYSYSF
jgi:hypothetical protein